MAAAGLLALITVHLDNGDKNVLKPRVLHFHFRQPRLKRQLYSGTLCIV